MKRVTRFIVLSLVLVLTMSIGFGLASAQDDDLTIVIGWEQEPSVLAPLSDMAFAAYMQNFYQRDLWDWDTNREIFPIMAEEIPSFENGMVTETEEGNTVVTYKLNEGMSWSDGEPVTSADCAFWHEIMMDPSKGTIQRSSYPDVVESLEVVDDLTFVLTYNRPFPDFLTNSTATCGYPEHILGPWVEENGTIDTAPYFRGEDVVGYGPYVFGEWVIGNSLTFDRNPYWGENEFEQVPAIDRVILSFITDTAQMQNAFETGQIDLAFNFRDTLVADYQAVAGAEVFSTPGVFGDAIWVNVGNGGHPALEDPMVIDAMIHAIDRATLAEELVGPGVGVPKSWFAEQFWPEDLPLLEYDPELAMEMLDEAGWVDSNENGIRDKIVVDDEPPVELVLRFYTTELDVRMDYQIFIQEYLEEVGIVVQLLPVPATILFAPYAERGILDTGAFDLALFALSTGPLSPFADASEWFGCGSTPSPENGGQGKNGWGWCDEEFDRLDLLVGETVDPVERMEYAHEAQRRFFEGRFWHGLYLRPTWYAVDGSQWDVDTMFDMGTLSDNYFNKVEYWEPA